MSVRRAILVAVSVLLFLAAGVVCLVLAFSLSGCTPPVFEIPNVHVVDTSWRVVREDHLAGRMASITTTAGIEAEIAEYNATHTDDQWRLVFGDVPPIEAAPTADAYIVYADTHEVESEYLNIARAEVVERRAAWRLQAELESVTSGRLCVLYVDNVPPAPTPPEQVDPYVQYALYIVVVGTGEIVVEEHATAESFATRLRALTYDVELHNILSPAEPAWALVSGRLWP